MAAAVTSERFVPLESRHHALPDGMPSSLTTIAGVRERLGYQAEER